MADSSREEKLAAARKKLKQFQKKSGKTPCNSPAGEKPKTKRQTTVVENKKYEEGKKSNGNHSSEVIANSESHNQSVDHVEAVPMSVNAGSLSPPPSTDTPDQSVYSTPPLNDSNHRPTASTESLQQLSRQINGLLSQSDAYVNGTIGDKYDNTVGELEKKHNTSLQQQVQEERGGFEERQRKELGALKEQLQVHIQTIGILVAEKTELQSSVNQSQRMAQQRLTEIEELSGRLKASRQRVADLERDLSSISTSSQQFEKSSKEYSKEIDRLKLDLYKLNKTSEETKQQNSELQEKLHSKVSECSGLEQAVQDLKSKLEMTEVYVQQLSNKEGSTDTNLLEKLQEEKISLQTKVDQYAESFQKLTTERDQLAEQYQQYINQLQQQQQQLVSQINVLTEEKEKLLLREQELEAALKTAQEKAEAQAQKAEELNDQSKPAEVASPEVLEQIEKLKVEYDALSRKYQTQVNDNSQLSRLISEKEGRIMELESTLSRVGEDSIDKDELLESMQSDKVALSRAMAQNKDLKQQLAELQNGFVKLSNESMELTTDLQSEKHVSRELATRLSQQEDELKEIREHLADKEHELQHLKHLSVQHYQHEQLEDRMRHYEAQGTLVENLQRDLAAAQDAINALTSQNSDLRTMLAKSQEKEKELGNITTADGVRKDDVVASLSASIQQLEMERNQILQQYEEEQEKHYQAKKKAEQAEKQKDELEKKLEGQVPATHNGEVITKEQYESLQHVMELLEDKYTSAMRAKAELIDRNEQLEHLTMQLEGETETIGEYVSLYQHQRAALRQKQEEKEAYIQRLSLDREEMRNKLGELQALVVQLMQERNMLQTYHSANQTPSPQTGPHTGPQAKTKKHINGTLDSSQLDDWPDYGSSSSDSDVSEVEAVIAGSPSSSKTESKSTPAASSPNPAAKNPEQQSTWTPQDETAHKIMHLLNELGNPNMVQNVAFSERNFHPCTHCKGRLLSL
ncbi:golgin subfamily A member 2 isoform X2 [Lingula anatina]|uniref:Golgin subfamily A member 2 isoform X2 n=1 Tax=Lingula anatina TaxID=7574 RepID=A0A1S3HL52_LINAN|nr:golgin subfamily A member 2 isoform X2 [Lingula anatina]|eukprot:XP_013386833.1 golgin subfamily A member 2 isoform X2 [Lingula anatina]